MKQICSGRMWCGVAVLLGAVLCGGVQTAAHAGWKTATDVQAAPNDSGKADDRWANKDRASDNDAARYSVDKSNRTGNGAWLQLDFLKDGKGIRSNRLRVNADFWAPIADRVDIRVRYDGEKDFVAVRIAKGEVPNARFEEIALPREGLVNAVRFRWHYLKKGYWFWLYELQIFEVDPPPVEPPAVETADPGSVNLTSAVLCGLLTEDGGGACQVRFVYGTDSALETGALTTDWKGTFGADQRFTAFVKNLVPKTRYHFRAEVKNAWGTRTGEIKSFVACAPEGPDGSVWVSPSGWGTDGHVYKEARYSWSDGSSAFDDWADSAARCYHQIHDPELWSPWLYLDLDSGLYSGLRFRAGKPDGFVEQVDIDVLSSHWEHVYDGGFVHNEFNVEDFAIREVSRVRMRFKMSKAGVGAYWNLFEFDLRRVGVNLIAEGLPHYMEEFPGVILGSNAALERITARFGPGIEKLTSGTVKVHASPNMSVYADIAEWDKWDLKGRVFDLADQEQRKAFHDLVLNKTILFGGSSETSSKQAEEQVRITLDYDNMPVSDQVNCTYAELKITQVPRFLFANAKYATTIRFEVLPKGMKGYAFGQLEARFKVGSESVKWDVAKRVVGVASDGKLGAVGKATAAGNSVFEAYVPSRVDRYVNGAWKSGYYFYYMQLPEGDTASGQFRLSAKFMTGNYVTRQPGPLSGDACGHVQHFADLSVPAADIPMTKNAGPLRPLPSGSTYAVVPKRRWEAVAGWDDWGGVRYAGKESGRLEGNRPYWDWPKQPQWYISHLLHPPRPDDFKPMFEKASLLSSTHCSEVRFDLLKDGHDAWGAYKPIICGKNYGKREGVWLCVSYGGKNAASHQALAAVLEPGEAAMDYSRNSGSLMLSFFAGKAFVGTRVDDPPANPAGDFGSAAAIVAGLFGPEGQAVAKIIGAADVLFSTVDKLSQPDDLRGAKARIAPYFSLIHPDHSAENPRNLVGATIHNPAYELNNERWTVRTSWQYVSPGEQMIIYVDYATWAQQRSEGYWDLFGQKPPECWGRVKLTPSETEVQTFFKMCER